MPTSCKRNTSMSSLILYITDSQVLRSMTGVPDKSGAEVVGGLTGFPIRSVEAGVGKGPTGIPVKSVRAGVVGGLTTVLIWGQ